MISLDESVCVGQFAKKSRSNRSFVRSFSRVSGSGESVRLSSPSFSFLNESRSYSGANSHQSTQH